METMYEELDKFTKDFITTTLIKTEHINLSARGDRYYVEIYEHEAGKVTVEVMFDSEGKARQMFDLLQEGQIFFDRSEYPIG